VSNIERIRERQTAALYPELLSLPHHHHDQALYARSRPHIGIVAVALRHSDLTSAQMRALDEFRLDQYLLCGFYNEDYVETHHITHDPDLHALPRDTIHLMVGTSEGRFLAYSYIQPPKGAGETGSHVTMADPQRPWFPCEIESFGPIFSSLPALRAVPVRRLAEVSILLKNQVAQGTLSRYAVVEDVLALTLLQISTRVDLDATFACCDFEARKVIYDLGMTALYAPYTPVIYNNLRPHWSAGANEPGRVWPAVFSSVDFRRDVAHLDALDHVLNLTPHEVRSELVAWRRQGRRIESRALLPAPGASDVLWVATPELDPVPSAAGTG
jgi:hypothetical protein